MIRLVEKLPDLKAQNAEYIKIRCLYEAYKNDDKVLFWVQDDNKAIISMTDSNMIIYNVNADMEELCEFVAVLNPAAIYSDYTTLTLLGKKPKERINVMSIKADIQGEVKSDALSSKEIYELLDVQGLSLPEYPHFAVDYCRRLNMGSAKYFALKDKCAIITFNSGDFAIINGLASSEKGFGSIALENAMKLNFGKTLFVCCRDKVKGFYEKYGFKRLYFSGYWVKNDEYN